MLLVVLAAVLSISSSVLSLLGPKFSGKAINAIKPGVGRVDMDTVLHYAMLMAICYVVSAVLSYALAILMTVL